MGRAACALRRGGAVAQRKTLCFACRESPVQSPAASPVERTGQEVMRQTSACGLPGPFRV